VTETIEYEQFEQSSPSAGEHASDVDLSRLSDIPMELSVEIGRTHMTVGETLDLRVGSVVTLERLAGEAADLLVNGSAIARGEVVVIDEQYGLRITEILDAHPDTDTDTELAAPASAPAAGAAQALAEAEASGVFDSPADAPAASADGPAADAAPADTDATDGASDPEG
jgi:flagellar motor switch protein FliN/FliY